MQKVNIVKSLILLPMIFLFIPSMYLPGGIPMYDVIMGFTIILLLISNKNITFIKDIVRFYKQNFSVKVLFIYIIYVLLSGLLFVALGKYSFIYALYALLVLFLYNNVSWFLYPTLIFPKFISLKTLIKILIISYYIICIYGLLVYIFDSFGIPILEPIHHLLVNRRTLGSNDASSLLYTSRVLSVFEEPGYFGGFLCISLPIIFSVILTKYKIFKNKYINFIFKKSYIPVLVITIILIKSPIWLIFSIIVSLVYFKDIILKKIKRHFISIVILTISLILSFGILITKINYQKTYINRAVNVLSKIRSMEDFILIEPSLANRIINYSVRFNVFLKHPIIGVGYRNTEYNVSTEFNNRPLTKEIQECILNSKNGFIHMNGSILWNTLSDTGLIGFILYYGFVISLIKTCDRLIKHLPLSLELNSIQGIRKTYIAILCFSFYDIRLNFHYYWFLFGLTLVFVKYYQNYNRSKIDENINN